MKERFKDTGESIYSFMDKTFIVCPQCSGRAVSQQLEKESQSGWFTPRRLTCVNCSYVKEWAGREIARGWYDFRDDYFALPLWLQTPCCSEVLWAYNENHLTFLENFVGARLRERVRDDKHGWSNGSLASRLPAWIQSRKNRDEVLKGLSRLQVDCGRPSNQKLHQPSTFPASLKQMGTNVRLSENE